MGAGCANTPSLLGVFEKWIFQIFLFNFTFNFYGTPFNSNTVVVSRTKFELR